MKVMERIGTSVRTMVKAKVTLEVWTDGQARMTTE